MEFYKPVSTVNIKKLAKDEGNGGATRERAIRLYCTAVQSAWQLQIRGPLGLGWAGTKDGKDFVVAGVSLDRENMEALRDSITKALQRSDSPSSSSPRLRA